MAPTQWYCSHTPMRKLRGRLITSCAGGYLVLYQDQTLYREVEFLYELHVCDHAGHLLLSTSVVDLKFTPNALWFEDGVVMIGTTGGAKRLGAVLPEGFAPENTAPKRLPHPILAEARGVVLKMRDGLQQPLLRYEFADGSTADFCSGEACPEKARPVAACFHGERLYVLFDEGTVSKFV